MITQETLDLVAEIGKRVNLPMAWVYLGFACGKVERALPGAPPSREFLESVAASAAKGRLIQMVEAEIDGWIAVRDRMRRTRLRRPAAAERSI